MAGGWVYFMTNRRNGVLYAGVTSNLPKRAWEHREGVVEGFTKRYGLKMLVYYECSMTFATPSAARRQSSIGRVRGRCG
jgi:predicted GIY-YIG superfamily endonuclease